MDQEKDKAVLQDVSDQIGSYVDTITTNLSLANTLLKETIKLSEHISSFENEFNHINALLIDHTQKIEFLTEKITEFKATKEAEDKAEAKLENHKNRTFDLTFNL